MRKSVNILLLSSLCALICGFSLFGCARKESLNSAPAKSIAFSDGYDKENVTVEKVKITDGNTGKSVETKDPQKIQALFAKLDNQKLTFQEGPSTVGWSYSIECTCKGIPGFFSYTLDSGFLGFDGYSGKLITGFYVAKDYHSVYKVMQDFYDDLR
jgi:hypothetical protein